MATVQKRGNSYKINVSFGYSVNGKQVRQSMTWKPSEGMSARQIEKEVQRQAVLFEESCKRGQTTAAVKFEDFARKWFEEVAELKLKRRTVVNYKGLEARVYKAIGHLRIDRITPREIQRFISSLSNGERFDKREHKLSPKTVKNHVSFISTVFNYAMKMQLVRDNPCRMAELPRAEEVERDVYTIEEAQTFLDFLQKQPAEEFQHVAFFTLAIFTGLRRGELLGLEWKDIDFDMGLVSVKRTSNYTNIDGVYTDTPKNRRSRRTLNPPPEVMSFLERYKLQQQNYIEAVGSEWTDTDRLFTQWNGAPMFPNSVQHFLKRFCKKAGLRCLSTHAFRHFTASALIHAGVNVKTIQAILGHSTPATTMSIYLHTFEAAQAAAMRAITSTVNLKPVKSISITEAQTPNKHQIKINKGNKKRKPA
jgi:integrase